MANDQRKAEGRRNPIRQFAAAGGGYREAGKIRKNGGGRTYRNAKRGAKAEVQKQITRDNG